MKNIVPYLGFTRTHKKLEQIAIIFFRKMFRGGVKFACLSKVYNITLYIKCIH